MEALGINLGYLLVQIVNFLIVLIVLYAWVLKPVVALLEKRRKTIAQGLEDARVAAEARKNAEKDAEKIVNDAQLKSGEMIREASERAETVGREIEEAARVEASKFRDGALAEVQVERDRILGSLRGQVAALAISVAQKLIGETLDERRQRSLIDEFFSGVREGRVTILDGASLSGPSADVVSALPLTPEEQERVKNELLSKIGSQATVTFRVDPSILGGLIIRVGDKVMDASVAGQLENMRAQMY